MTSQAHNPRSTQAEYAKPFSLKQFGRYIVPAALLATASMFAGYQAARWHGDWGSSDAVQAASLSPASAEPEDTALDPEQLAQLPPEQQAERLLERAIHRDPEAPGLIANHADAWRGHIENTARLSDLVQTALNSTNLGTRGAAVEIDLAANNLSKSPDSVARLIRQLQDDPTERPAALWKLGALGNRGVEPELVLSQLLTYLSDPDEQIRYWAVEGLAVLGSDGVVDPLLDRFAHDPSSRVRQRAACNLAESGMLTKEQRLAAVPQLLNFFDDDALDSQTRSWVYGALRLITGAPLGNDPGAWRKWWANHGTREKQASRRTGILFA